MKDPIVHLKTAHAHMVKDPKANKAELKRLAKEIQKLESEAGKLSIMAEEMPEEHTSEE